MDEIRAYVVIVVIRAMYAGFFLLTKAAFNDGMNSFVFVFYRQALATIFLVPLAILFERKTAPPLSFPTFWKIFVLSLVGITFSLDLSGLATVYTSATLAAASTNTLPVITFFLALLLRMETVNLKIASGFIKILGVIFCLAGAATLAFYRGPQLKPLINHHPFGKHRDGHLDNSSSTWIKGCFLMLTSNIFWGFWIVLQGRVLMNYPSKLLFTTLQCFLSTVQSFVVAISVERNINMWKLDFNVGLVAVAYSGIVVTGVGYYLQAWCIEKKGPVFLAMWTPLSLILTMFCSVLFLGEVISLGSILGGFFLVGGLYSVLWGKSRESKDEKSRVEDEKNKERSNGELVRTGENRGLDMI